MTYSGSKAKLKNDIPPIINKYIKDNNITTFIDCCCGGANLTDKIICNNTYAIDLSPTLIALHKQAQEDFSKIPINGSMEEWDKCYSAWKQMFQNIKNKSILNFKEQDFNVNIPLYEIGAIEWYASFSNRGFPGGYAKNTVTRNYYQEAWRNHKKQSENENYKKIKFFWGDYQEFIKNKKFDIERTLIYIDPPYNGTKGYGICKDFNYLNFYKWLKEISKIYPIFVSEQYLPSDFDEYKIWKKEVKRTVGSDNTYKAVETLWLIDRRDKNEYRK